MQTLEAVKACIRHVESGGVVRVVSPSLYRGKPFDMRITSRPVHDAIDPRYFVRIDTAALRKRKTYSLYGVRGGHAAKRVDDLRGHVVRNIFRAKTVELLHGDGIRTE